MRPLSAEAQVVIDAARALGAPPPGAQSAVRAALDARILAGAAAGVGAAHGALGAGGAAAKGGVLGASLATKIVVGALVSVGVGTVGTVAVHRVVAERHAVVERLRAAPRLMAQPSPVQVPVPDPTPRTSGPRAIVTPPLRAMVEHEATCGIAAEVKLLQQAQRDLQEHRPDQVLMALDRASTACPGADLDQERLGFRILALCQEGRTSEAHAATQQLEREAPQSPSLDRIHSECP